MPSSDLPQDSREAPLTIRFIYFDCMDTLVQMKIPSMEVYPWWAFERAADLGIWSRYSDFREDWMRERRAISRGPLAFREGTVEERLEGMIREALRERKLEWGDGEVRRAVREVHAHFWRRYLEASSVEPEVVDVLEWLERDRRIPLGIVSNFMVPGGIGEILARHGISRYFDIVLVSCSLGWRKPADLVYRTALAHAGRSPEEVLFVGDNRLADHDGPRIVGMQTLLLDPDDAEVDVAHRVRNFAEVRERLAGMIPAR